MHDELNGPAVSALRVRLWKLSNMVDHRMGDQKISRAPPCFGRHVKPVPAVFAVVSTYHSALSPCGGLRPVLLHKEGLCPSIGDINRLMMMMNMHNIADKPINIAPVRNQGK
jgi:hypothetical protein